MSQPQGGTTWKPAWAGAAVLVGLVPTVAARMLVREGGDPRIGVAVGVLALTFSGVVVALAFAAVQGRARAVDLGLRPAPVLHSAVLVLLVWMAIVVIIVVWLALLSPATDEPSLTDRLAADAGVLHALLVLAIAAVASPLAEELLFRGLFFGTLRTTMGLWPAALTASVVFAATHLGWIPRGHMVPVFVAGLLFCLLYHWTGSLYPPLAAHALLNSVSFGPALGWTWQLPLAMASSVAVTLAIARLIAVLLGDRRGQWLPARRMSTMATADNHRANITNDT